MRDNDGMALVCFYFMKHLRKRYRGHKAEISSKDWIKEVKKFTLYFGVSEKAVLKALINRGFFEASAIDTYMIRYDLAL